LKRKRGGFLISRQAPLGVDFVFAPGRHRRQKEGSHEKGNRNTRQDPSAQKRGDRKNAVAEKPGGFSRLREKKKDVVGTYKKGVLTPQKNLQNYSGEKRTLRGKGRFCGKTSTNNALKERERASLPTGTVQKDGNYEGEPRGRGENSDAQSSKEPH